VILYAAATLVYLLTGETVMVRWLWFSSVVVLLISFLRKSRIRDFWTFDFWEYSLLALIVAGAFALRYVDLTNIPQHIANDVAIMGLKSRDMLQANDGRWVGMSVVTDHPFSEHQMLMLGMRLFGVSHYGLAMLSVIAGTASVVALHYLGRILFNRWVGLIAAGFWRSSIRTFIFRG
jgi:4-amino-4-deoxy-L-arabinose transferase-like glycosyltransferase